MKYSKEGQDQFALLCSPQKGPKFYLDLGSAHPDDGNNTVRLEEQGWDGLRFDINPHVLGIKSKRTSHTIIGDVSAPGFLAQRLKAFGVPELIHYISFDVDDGTLGAVEHFPWDNHAFACMTFEHDSRSTNFARKQAMFRALESYNYGIIQDVCYEDKGLHVFEDWYFHRHMVPPLLLPKLFSCPSNAYWKDVLEHLST